jgi:ABC-type polysaccharide/polyol phosphate export permease
MDLSEYASVIADFYQAQPLIAVACVIFLIFLLWRKPKFFLSVLILALILAAILHFITNTASSSLSLKKELIDKTGIHKED